LKGGVGKTTVAAGIGLSLSEQRGDRVVAVDAAPDQGTLADRLTGPLPAGVQQLLAARDGVDSVSELSRYTGLAGRLTVVSGEQDPAAADGFRGEEHRQVTELLGRYFDILITDCGPGMMHSAVRNAVAEADTIVVVADLALDGAGRASATLDWLAAHGHRDKAGDAIVALCSDRAGAVVRIEPVREHFRDRARAVVDVPHDPALVAGARIRVEHLRPRTRDSFLELGALVADGFAG
ncbi:MAG: MinD/ParA family protein, partial [Actinomycetota bacterium]|nr:MinD/ParA family protein [Actinomycetota bacterium]